MKHKRLVIKIGSNVLTTSNGELNIERIDSIVRQVATLYKEGIEIILVSSGAIASGRGEMRSNSYKLDTVSIRQLYSAVGQVKLLNHYYSLFRKENIFCGQVLTTKESFSTRVHYLNQRHCMQVLLDSGVIPIVNENDTISVTELMFTDNDELAGLVSTMMSADALIILSNIDGIYNGNPTLATSEVIREISANKDISEYIQATHSEFGRGGMLTKSRIAQKLATEGIEVFIANGTKENILIDIVHHNDVLSTRFTPAVRTISSIKKWIAHSNSFAKGEVHINEGAYQMLLAPKAISILFIGVIAINGNFEKGDIIKIIFDNHCIGFGKVAFGSEKAKEMIGQKGNKPIIHYDYLYLD